MNKTVQNPYQIRGDVTAILIKRRDGRTLECLIDTEDLDAVRIPGCWITSWSESCKTFYVTHSRGQKIKIHRLLRGSPPLSVAIDHRNHDGLDNRKENIVVCTHFINNVNKRAGSNSTTGERGITWCARIACWRVRVTARHIGYFKKKQDAVEARNYAIAEALSGKLS